jgi:transposase
MRFVPIKTDEQQAVLCVHRVRQSFVKARTAQANQIRGLLAEFGIVILQGLAHIARRAPQLMEQPNLPESFRVLLQRLYANLTELDKQVDELEATIAHWHRESDLSCKLAEVPGIGPITATALVASVGDAKNFKNGRQLAAWLGLVPRQHSSGGKSVLLGISKRGDTYLRTLLIHGARSVIRHAQDKPATDWLGQLLDRRNKNIAAVALANKNGRTVWALLTRRDQRFRPGYAPVSA